MSKDNILTHTVELPLPPMSQKEMTEQGLEQLDFVYICGDAFVDHSSFGSAIITRVLQVNGYSVGIIAQPDWHSADDFKRLGRPRLAFLVSAGNLDSMVNHYTAAKKRRSTDAYSPLGKSGNRPDRACIVYANRCREAYRDVPVVLGGIEASLRRFAHYDYWDDKVRRSILFDAQADILIYGMGERQIVAIADALAGGLPAQDITYIDGTCYLTSNLDKVYEYDMVPSFEDVKADKVQYAKAFMREYEEQDAIRGKRLVQPHEGRYLVANPPALPLTQEELDAVYDLPYTRKVHPFYQGKHIPALDEVKFSLTSSRGCFGGCSFCALTFHEGRVVQARSHQSLIKEAKLLSKLPDFKGYIHDVGGPTADFRQPACKEQLTRGSCKNKQCIGWKKCDRLTVSHSDYVELLRKLRSLPGIKKVFIRSGVRYDYVMYDKNDRFFREMVAHHISGQLRVAPEHVNDRVLYYMGKPKRECYDAFVNRFEQICRHMGLEQYIVPYFISSHPGSDLNAAIELAQYLKNTSQHPEQVQDFYPTPGTLSTCMYYTELDPRTMKPLYVAKTQQEKGMQRALLQYFQPRYMAQVRKALEKAGRDDLIGYGKNALVPPAQRENDKTVPPKGGKMMKKKKRR